MFGKKKKKKSAAGGLVDILATMAVDGSGEKLNSSHNIKAGSTGYTHTHARTHARTNARMHARRHARTHKRTRTHTHTHARTNAQPKPNQTRVSILTAYIDKLDAHTDISTQSHVVL